MDIESIRKRDQYYSGNEGHPVAGYATSVAREDSAREGDGFLADGIRYQRDAFTDRRELLSEVDRLNSWLSEARKARDEARNERDAARAEVEQMAAIVKWTSDESLADVMEAVRQRDEARAEVEKLCDCAKPGASVTDPACGTCIRCLQELVQDAADRAEQGRSARKEIEKLRAENETYKHSVSLTDRQLLATVSLWLEEAQAEVRRLDAENAGLRAEVEKIRAAMSELVDDSVRLKLASRQLCDALLSRIMVTHLDMADAEAIEASKRFVSLIGAERMREQKEEIEKLRAIVEQCRPVVEAVQEFQACGCDFDSCRHLNAIINVELHTMPEVKP